VLTLILRKFLKPYRLQVAFVMILLLLQAIFNLYLPNLNADLINNGVAKGNVSYIWHIGQIMLASSLLVMGASVLIAYFAAKVSMAFGRDLRSKVF